MNNDDAVKPIFISEKEVKSVLNWALVNEAVEEALCAAVYNKAPVKPESPDQKKEEKSQPTTKQPEKPQSTGKQQDRTKQPEKSQATEQQQDSTKQPEKPQPTAQQQDRPKASEKAQSVDVAEKKVVSPAYSNQPARTCTYCGSRSTHNGLLLAMPGFVGNYHLSGREQEKKPHNTLACKLITAFKGNENKNPPLPQILANVLLFDVNTGKLRCVIDGTELTAWRTAAASIVASKYLFFNNVGAKQQEKILAIVGCGVQGKSHAIGFCSTFDNINEVRLWNRTRSKAEALAVELHNLRASFKSKALKVLILHTVRECVQGADVIITATNSPQPLIEYDMLKSTVHINAIGFGTIRHSELSHEVYERASIYIDYWSGAKVELKDLKDHIICEVGELILGKMRRNPEGISIFQSLGMASEDATVAQAIYEAVKGKS